MLALHVHHGLSERADAWLSHCRATCRRWARRGLPIEFACRRLDGHPRAGESVEAWARGGRYRALREMAAERSVDLVLLAHHRRDQAETFLLQALRGGGAATLAAMPRLARRDGVTWARPWLGQPREAIEAYARRHRLRWIEDDSNADERFARNRLRLRVWPALAAAFDDAEVALATAAARAAHASALLDEVGAGDVAMLASDDGLDLASWQRLSLPRRRQMLVSWLHAALAGAPPSSLVERLLREATADGHRRWPAAGRELHSYRGRLQCVPIESHDADPGRLVVDLSRPGMHAVAAWRGAFRVESVASGGIAVADAKRLVLRARAAGDSFQAGPRRPARSLKLQYQASGIAPALRRGPIVCSEDDVPVFVPGLGIDARSVAPSGQAQVAFAWLPERASERESEREGSR